MPKNMLYSDEEIKELFIECLVAQFLAEKHQDLLQSIRSEAERRIAKLDSNQLREAISIKIRFPAWTLTSILGSYQ